MTTARNRRFRFVPSRLDCLYVAELSDGRVKVGMTGMPKKRLTALLGSVAPLEMTRFFITDGLPCWRSHRAAEQHLIRRMRMMGRWTPGVGSEFFHGVPFRTALLEAECAQQWFTATAEERA